MRFQAMSPEERMVHFGEVETEFCSEDWREKFKKFTQQFPPDSKSPKQPIEEEIFKHSQVDKFCVDPNANLSGCEACREAFWKLVVLTSMDW